MRRIVKEKTERALGVKLFLKADRCNSPKCVMIRRPFRPGIHGQDRRRPVSEYGKQLQEKQKIQIYFGLTTQQMRRLFQAGATPDEIREHLEHRLDQVVFLLGLARSTRIARQLISHGHILVNGRKTTIPSYRVALKDTIAVRPESRGSKLFEDIQTRLKAYEPPAWLSLRKEELAGACVGSSARAEAHFPFDIAVVGQFFSR